MKNIKKLLLINIDEVFCFSYINRGTSGRHKSSLSCYPLPFSLGLRAHTWYMDAGAGAGLVVLDDDLGPDTGVGAVIVDIVEVVLEHIGAEPRGEEEREEPAISVDRHQSRRVHVLLLAH